MLSLSADLEKQFLAEEGSDVVFEIGGETIPAHKFILTARVPAFERMFSAGMKEAQTGRIPIDDTDAASFKHVLKFIYCGKIPDDEVLDAMADSLLPITEKYGIADLKDACAASLKGRIDPFNVINTLVMAHHYRCTDLKKECFSYLAELQTPLDGGEIEMLRPYPDLMVEAIQQLMIAICAKN